MYLNPLVSVIVPVYNVECYFPACIDSLLHQTYTNLEIWLVNDGSTDASPALCDAAAEADARVRVLHQQNGGAAAARNAALDAANGDFCAFVDGDDTVLPDYIATLYRDLASVGADIACCGWQDVTDDTDCITTNKPEKVCEWACEDAMEHLLYQRSIDSSMWSKLFRAELFEGLRFPLANLYEDLAIIYKLFGVAQRVVYRDYAAYCYRLREQGTTLAPFTPQKMDLADVADDMLVYMRQHYPALELAAMSRFVRASFHLYLQIPRQAQYAYHRKRLEDGIRRCRRHVLKDTQARRGTKAALWLSFFSFAAVYHLRGAKQHGKR